MNRSTHISICPMCGAIFSKGALNRINSKTESESRKCPSCTALGWHSYYAAKSASKLAHIYAASLVCERYIEAMYWVNDGVTLPQFVVEYRDDYFASWSKLVYPQGFTLIRPLGDGRPNSPVLLVCGFSRKTLDSVEAFEAAYSAAVQRLLEWANRWNVL